MSQHFDAVVIGTGQGGSPLAVRLAQSGRRTAVIERHLFGGTCVNVGCTPTKTYVASARAAHVARHAAEYGVMLEGEVRVDMARVKARKEEVIGQSRNGIEKWLRTTPDMTVFTGHGRFTGPHSIRVEGHDGQQHDLQADAVFINTGTRPVIPRIDGIERIPYLTNSTLLELSEVPAHLVIVGASYIALEFAQMFRRFGSRVTVLVRGKRVLSREDADFALSIQKVLAKEGVEFRFGAEPTRVEPAGAGVRIMLGDESDRRVASALRDRPHAQHRRSRARRGGHRGRPARPDRSRRPVAHEGRGHLGDRRRQRPRGVHAYVVQRLRGRRGEPARRRQRAVSTGGS